MDTETCAVDGGNSIGKVVSEHTASKNDVLMNTSGQVGRYEVVLEEGVVITTKHDIGSQSCSLVK